MCLAALHDGDKDRYLCALLTPEPMRGAIASIYAFNLELARIRELVSEPMMGEVRLQWWRDTLSGTPHGDAKANPIADALLETIHIHDLPMAPFLNMIEARQFDLYDDPMPDRSAFEGYAGETASSLIQLCCRVLDGGNSTRTADAAGHAGVAQLVAGCLLLMPIHRSRGQVYIPGDLLGAVGLDRDGFLNGRDKAMIDQALRGFIALGREHLKLARLQSDNISQSSFAAFLPAATIEMVLGKAEKLGASIHETPLAIAQWRRQWRFWSAARKGQL